MLRPVTLTGLAFTGLALAQRPANTSVCDFYTTALLKTNSAANQLTLLTLLVNTVVIGNYTQPNHLAVPGILAPGTYNGTAVNLLPYFDGGLDSSNDGSTPSGVAMNFLDDGGAAPLMMNKPSNGNAASNQYMLLTHLYQFFGILTGCSTVRKDPAFPAYGGDPSMYNVHKFMDLDQNEVGYFIMQVGLAAASFGVAAEDITAVGTALTKLFDYKCAPPVEIVAGQGPQLQAICIADTCPLSPNATCSSYAPAVVPGVANVTLAMGLGSNSTNATNTTATTLGGSMSPTASSKTTSSATTGGITMSTGEAAQTVGSFAVGGLALLAFLL